MAIIGESTLSDFTPYECQIEKLGGGAMCDGDVHFWKKFVCAET